MLSVKISIVISFNCPLLSVKVSSCCLAGLLICLQSGCRVFFLSMYSVYIKFMCETVWRTAGAQEQINCLLNLILGSPGSEKYWNLWNTRAERNGSSPNLSWVSFLQYFCKYCSLSSKLSVACNLIYSSFFSNASPPRLAYTNNWIIQ